MVVALSQADGAGAAEIKVVAGSGFNAVTLRGEIVAGDGERIAGLSAKARPKAAVVVLDSPGGDAIEGVRIANVLRENHLAAFIPREAECASACAIAFLGGERRLLQRGGRLGLHAPFRLGLDTDPLAPSRPNYGATLASRTALSLPLRIAITEIARAGGVSREAVDLMFRQLATMQLKYIGEEEGLRLGVFTQVIE